MKALIRPAMVFIPLGAGIFCPWAHELSFIIRWALAFMVFMVFLRLDVRHLAPRASHWKLLAANIAMGVVPYWLLHWLGFEELALAAFFVGITPTATAAAVVMGFLKGRVEYVVTGFVITNVAIAGLFPLLLPWITGNTSAAFVGKVIASLAFVLLLPLAAALLARRFYPRAVDWPGRCQTLSFGMWSLTLFVIAADAANFFQTNPHESKLVLLGIAVVSLVICVMNFALGYRLGEAHFRRECSQTLGQKNTTLTIFLALMHAGPLAAMGPVFYVLWHNSYNAVQMFMSERADDGSKSE